MIEINNLTKTYEVKKQAGKFYLFPSTYVLKALDNVTLTIPHGRLFGLLGPNGAGKTTLIKIICGLLRPTSGEIKINGRSPGESRTKIGLMLGYTMIYYRITGYDNLEYFARLYNIKNFRQRISELSDFLGLKDWLHEYVEHYSTGMKSKLALARALIHDPDILLLDEPTLGLDPAFAVEVRAKIKSMNKTILLTTHYMIEAEQLCDEIGFLKEGKLIKVDTSTNFKQITAGEEAISLEEVFIRLTHKDI